MTTDNKMKEVVQEMELLAEKKEFQIKTWKSFLERTEMHSITIQPEFLHALGDCFVLQQINTEFYQFINEQLDQITANMRERGYDLSSGKEIEELEYARDKVRAAYQSTKVSDKQRMRRYYLTVALVSVLVTLFSRTVIRMEEQKREREQKERYEHYQEMMEQQKELIDRQQEWMQNMLDGNREVDEETVRAIEQMMEEGIISQEVYDYLLEYYNYQQ